MEDVNIQENQENEREQYFRRIGKTASKYANTGSSFGVVKDIASLAMDLRQKVSDLEFSGSSFYFILILSIIKDATDIFTLSTTGWITTWPFTLLFFIFFFGRRSYFKRFIAKWGLRKFMVAFIMEMSPGVSFFPTFTFMTIMLKRRVEKETAELNSQIKEIEK